MGDVDLIFKQWYPPGPNYRLLSPDHWNEKVKNGMRKFYDSAKSDGLQSWWQNAAGRLAFVIVNYHCARKFNWQLDSEVIIRCVMETDLGKLFDELAEFADSSWKANGHNVMKLFVLDLLEPIMYTSNESSCLKIASILQERGFSEQVQELQKIRDARNVEENQKQSPEQVPQQFGSSNDANVYSGRQQTGWWSQQAANTTTTTLPSDINSDNFPSLSSVLVGGHSQDMKGSQGSSEPRSEGKQDTIGSRGQSGESSHNSDHNTQRQGVVSQGVTTHTENSNLPNDEAPRVTTGEGQLSTIGSRWQRGENFYNSDHTTQRQRSSGDGGHASYGYDDDEKQKAKRERLEQHESNKEKFEKKYVMFINERNLPKVREVVGDLFNSEDSLAHCVSEDFSMSAGIATQFTKRFPPMRDVCYNMYIYKGGVAPFDDRKNNRFIYNLVTKVKASDKPLYVDLIKALKAMRDHAVAKGVRRISMPQIGCGLDMLTWDIVLDIVEEIFYDTDITVTVYRMKDAPPSRRPFKVPQEKGAVSKGVTTHTANSNPTNDGAPRVTTGERQLSTEGNQEQFPALSGSSQTPEQKPAGKGFKGSSNESSGRGQGKNFNKKK